MTSDRFRGEARIRLQSDTNLIKDAPALLRIRDVSQDELLITLISHRG